MGAGEGGGWGTGTDDGARFLHAGAPSPIRTLCVESKRGVIECLRFPFTLNGKPAKVGTDDARRLLWVLRDDFGLTGTKFGCNIGSCGACTALVDGKAARACTTTLKSIAGKKVTTIEGLADGDKLAPVQQAFLEHLGFQCGYCTSGQIMNAHALLEANPKPTRDQIVQGMERNYCRCAAHTRIIEAIEAASKMTTVGGGSGDV